MSVANTVENYARLLSYCKTSKKKAQIMAELSLNDIEADAYTSILVRQRLLERTFDKYLATTQGNSYLDTRNRIEVAIKKSF